MSDLKLTVDYSQVKAANKEIGKIGKTAKKSMSLFDASFKKSLTSLRQQIALSKRMETQKAKEGKVAAAAAAEVAKEEERLKNKFVEGYTAMNIYTKELNDLAVARKKDIISASEQKAMVQQLNAQMKAGTGAFANAATGMQLVGKRANRTGVLAQQAGYQFGDFAVQVQSGTNVFVAFGQQATQLIGTLSMLAKSTKAIMAFSALGVIVPVITAIAGAFMRAKDSAVESATGMKAAFSDLPDYFEELNVSITDTFDVSFAKIENKYGEMFARLAKVKLQGTKDALKTAFEEEVIPVEEPSFLQKVGENIARAFVGQSGSVRAMADLEESIVEENKVANAVKEIQAAYVEAVDAATTFEEIVRLTEKTQRDLAKVSEDSADAFIAKAEEQGIVTAKVTEQQARDEDLLQRAREESNAELLLGEQMLAKERQRGLDQFNQDLEATNKTLDAMFQSRTLFFRIRFAGESEVMSQPLKPSGEFKPKQSFEELVKMGYNPEVLKGLGLNPKKTASSSSSSSKKTTPLQDLRKQLDLAEALNNKTKVQRELIQALGVNYKETYGPNTIADLTARIAKQEEVIAQEERMADLANTIGGAMSSSFMSIVDGTKSVKEAFKAMAADIIKHLFKVLVVQKMVKSFGGALSGSSSTFLQDLGGALSSYGGGVANGGPVQAGRSYTVGERGPEIFTPATAGNITPNSQAGGSGVTVVQNINISTGVQQTVRNEIRQLMPQIADSAKGAVADAKRRGGSYGRAFA